MIKFPIKLFYFSILPSSILYLAILYISYIHNIKLSLVIRDLAQTCGYPIGVGMISNIGILLWGAASSICFFTTFSESINRELSKLLFKSFILFQKIIFYNSRSNFSFIFSNIKSWCGLIRSRNFLYYEGRRKWSWK